MLRNAGQGLLGSDSLKRMFLGNAGCSFLRPIRDPRLTAGRMNAVSCASPQPTLRQLAQSPWPRAQAWRASSYLHSSEKVPSAAVSFRFFSTKAWHGFAASQAAGVREKVQEARFHRAQKARLSHSSPSGRPATSKRQRSGTQGQSQPNSDRLWVLGPIVLANILIFLAFQNALKGLQSNNDAPRELALMVDNLFLNLKNLREGRLWTVLTAGFTHTDSVHLATNMFTLSMVGWEFFTMISARRFLAIYIGGILASSAAALTEKYIAKNEKSTVGASGGLYAVIGALAWMIPRATFTVFGIIPIPAWAILPAMFCFDTLSNTGKLRSLTIDTTAHLGGAAFGVLYAFRMCRPAGRLR